MKLIDGDALSETLRESLKIFETHGVSVLGVPKALLAIVENAPTVDAKPVRHGRWTDGEDQYWLRATCSVCGSHPWRGFIPSAEMLKTSNKYNYCPTCGAKMDGGENDGKAD